MRTLTAWVLDAAVSRPRQWRAQGHELAVSVNVSASDLLTPGLIDVVVGALDRYRLPARMLVLEITETSIISDFERSATSSPSFGTWAWCCPSTTSAPGSPRSLT